MSLARRSIWIWLPLVAVVLISLVWVVWYGAALWRLNSVKSEVRSAGFPDSAAEVIPGKIPDHENAAPLLVSVQKIWDEVKDSKGFIKASPGAGDAERDPLMFDGAKMEQLQLQMRQPGMQELFMLMTEASRKPAARFDRDYSRGAMIELGPHPSMLAGAQLLCAKAWMAARQGDEKEVVEDLLVLSRLASFGLEDILLIGWLVGASIDQLSINAAPLVLAELPAGSFQMEDWKALDESWATHREEARGDLVRALEAERALFGAWLFEGALAGRLSLGPTVVQTLPAKNADDAADWRRLMSLYQTVLAPMVVADYSTYLRHMITVRNAVKEGAPRKTGDDSFASRVPRLAVLTRLAAPAYDGILKKLAEYEVNLQLGRLGLALEDFRSHEGKYPATLPDLGLPEATITDPFTGRPFIYRTERDNVLVYSVGFDREDDGGVPRASGGRRDLVWRIERDEVGHE